MKSDLQHDVLTWYQSLQPASPAEMVGLWKGTGLPSGHPLDGVLENLQWFGKHFHEDMRADALLFQSRPGRLVAIEPAWIPIRIAINSASFGRTSVARNWFGHLQKMLRARGRTAALEPRLFEGIESAAMVYDRQPIIDYFRKISEAELAGMMVVKDDPRRYFFKLRRADACDRF